jgi:LacI family transcriptional regulator
MRDVARLAGVGLGTVSRIVNGAPGVNPELVERVTDAARLLDYRHDSTASSLRRADRRTGTVGMIVENVANPYSSALQRAVEDAADQRGLLLLSGSNDEDPARERRLLDNLTQRRVDGLIIVPTGRVHDALVTARRRGVPIVCVDRPIDLDEVDSVTVDNRRGVRDAVRRLHELGHRRIAFLSDLAGIWTSRERHAGFVEGLAAVGCALDESLVRRDLHDETEAESALRELFTEAEPPSAILAAQNLVTIGALTGLRALGLAHRVALVGFDDFPLADMLTPRVSVIAQDVARLGATAAELLFARLDGETGPARHRVLPTTYIARGSGEITPTS